MILDNYLIFSGTMNGGSGAPAVNDTPYDSPTTGPQQALNIVDLGLSGLPTSANGGGARDLGVGDDPALKLMVRVTTAMVGGTSLQVQLQGAPDNGSGSPGSWTTMWSSAAILTAQLFQGARLANVDVPRPVPGQPLPRFLRLQYVSVGTFDGTGRIESTIVLDRDDQIVGTGGNYSGYPAGIAIAN